MRAMSSFAQLGLSWCVVCALGGCVTNDYPLIPAPPPYMLLPVDETMTCDGIAASFRFAAWRAAPLEYWLSAGAFAGAVFQRNSSGTPPAMGLVTRRDGAR